MTEDADSNAAPNLFGPISEADRRAALDIVGRTLIAARDAAVLQWDQIIAGTRKYGPWERIRAAMPAIDDRSVELLKAAIPNVVDTFMYCLLAALDGNQSVDVAVKVEGRRFENVTRLSWGLAAEPTGNDGWLRRFSRQRFDQPV